MGDNIILLQFLCWKSISIRTILIQSLNIEKSHLLLMFMQRCARFTEIASELTKTWSSGATQFGV